MRRNNHWALKLSAITYVLALVLLSLFPFEGWAWNAASPWDFLFQPVPKYRTPFDFWSNLLAYMPLGLIWASLSFVSRQDARNQLGHQQHYPLWPAMLRAIIVGVTLSFLMECAQTYLPSRRAQWLDLLANGMGTGLGALFWAAGTKLKAWHAARNPTFRGNICPLPLPGGSGVGLLLLGIWLVGQASPQALWLALGDLMPGGSDFRPWLWLLGMPTHSPRGPAEQIFTESILVASGLLVLLILVRLTLMSTGYYWANSVLNHWGRLVGFTFVLALLSRAIWIGLLTPAEGFSTPVVGSALGNWLSAGVQTGIFLACIAGAGLFTLSLTATLRLAIGLALINLFLSNSLPTAGYEPEITASWATGQWFNLRGLAAVSAAIWPFLVITWFFLVLRTLPKPNPTSVSIAA